MPSNWGGIEIKTKLQESNMKSQVNAAHLAPKPADRHRQLGMHTVKHTLSASRGAGFKRW